MGNSGERFSGIKADIGAIEANQSTASRENSELGKSIDASEESAKSIATDNRQSGQLIDDAQNQLDKLGKDLGL